MTAAEAAEVNFNLTWRFAKTMPEIPHEYVVRSPDNEANFAALSETINKHGRWGTFRGNRYRYWYPGNDFKYWTIRRIINRARIDGAAITPKHSYPVQLLRSSTETKITTTINKYRRNKQLAAVWKRTARDVRHVIDGRRWILALRKGGTELIPLDHLSDAEIAERLPSRRSKAHRMMRLGHSVLCG